MQLQIELSGEGLTPDTLATIAAGAPVRLNPDGLSRMRMTCNLLREAIEGGEAIYGVTTGLGPRVVDELDDAQQKRMSRRTIRGRAHAVGAPLPPSTVRAAMAVRTNTLLNGASGADPDLARLLAACLNAGVSPVVRETGSVGAADLMWGAGLGLGIIGEGQMDTPQGRKPAGEALIAVGLAPYDPGPREGLALASHSSFTGAIAALALNRAENVFESIQTAAALSLEAFRANLSPLRFRTLALRPQPGQMAAAAGISARLENSALQKAGAARRVQDPLSLRNIAQIHGAVVAALDTMDVAVRDEINGASDNPVVLVRTGEVLSSGGYLTPHLSIVLNMMSQAFVHLAAAQVARMAKQVNPRFSDLPVGLVPGETDSAGVAPAMKSAEALFAEIAQMAQPAPVYPGGGADGVEDIVSHAAVPAKALHGIIDRLERLCALELLIATQAAELRDGVVMAPMMRATMETVRSITRTVTEDRPLADDIEAMTTRVAAGAFAEPELFDE